MRKIIQIATAISNNDENTRLDGGLYALCEDGTLWVMWFDDNEFRWRQLPPIPQDERPKHKFYCEYCKEKFFDFQDLENVVCPCCRSAQ